MAYCTNCGAEVENGTVICPNCGVAQNAPAPAEEDNGGFLWGLLGCCVPIVGLVLFLVWKDTKPRTAKAAGIGALISVVCIVAFYILMIVLGVGLSILGTSYYY